MFTFWCPYEPKSSISRNWREMGAALNSVTVFICNIALTPDTPGTLPKSIIKEGKLQAWLSLTCHTRLSLLCLSSDFLLSYRDIAFPPFHRLSALFFILLFAYYVLFSIPHRLFTNSFPFPRIDLLCPFHFLTTRFLRQMQVLRTKSIDVMTLFPREMSQWPMFAI